MGHGGKWVLSSLLARKDPTLVATFPHKTSITTGSGAILDEIGNTPPQCYGPHTSSKYPAEGGMENS